MIEPTSLRALLERLADERVIRLDPRLALQVETLLAARSHEDPRALAAALASLCAHTPERWRAVHRRCLDFFATHARVRPSAIPGVAPELPPVDLRTVFLPESPPPPPPSRRGWFIGGGLALAGLAVLIVLLRPPEPVEVPPESSTTTSEAVDATSPATTQETLVVPETTGQTTAATNTTATPTENSSVETTTTSPESSSGDTTATSTGNPPGDTTTAEPAPEIPQKPPTPPRIQHRVRDPLPSPLPTALVGLLVSVLLLTFGARWLASPALRRLRLRAQRANLREKSRGSHVIYHIPRHLPFSAEIIDAAATMLGYVPGGEGGRDLDIDATIDATSRAVGRVVPVMQPGLVRRDLVILVQLGKSSAHPLLSPVEAILDRWRRAGLTYARHDFQAQIEDLRAHPRRTPVALDALARRSEGCPLLIIAHSTDLVDKHRTAGWLRHLQSWPVRAMLDLDPRRNDELADTGEHDALASRNALDRAGLRRFSFTGEGLDALARYVSSGGRVQMVDEDPGLRSHAELAGPLAKWASCLACVPDPSWDQLEDFRRRFNHRFFDGQLDDPRHVWRLLEWLRREKNVPQPIAPDGRSIDIADDIITGILADLKRADLATGAGLEDAAHERILEQLAGAAPTTDYDRGRQALKQIEHRALLSKAPPATAGPTFTDFIGTPFELDVLRLARLTEERFVRAGQSPPAWVQEVLHGVCGDGTSTSDLLEPGAWRRAPWLLSAGLAGVGTWLTWGGAVSGSVAGVALSAAGGALTAGTLGGLAWLRRREMSALDDERTTLLTSVAPGDPEGPQPSPAIPEAQTAPVSEDEPDEPDDFDELTPREKYALALRRPLPSLGELGGLDDPPTGEAFGIVHVTLRDVAPMVFIGLSGGNFTMGSRDDDEQAYNRERRRHRSHVSAFAIAATPVTQAQFRAVMGKNPSHFEGPDLPVEKVSWIDAIEFCNVLSDRENLTRCYQNDGKTWRWNRDADGYRLPTEAEWEFACRAGTTTQYGFVAEEDKLSDYAWFDDNADDKTHPVATKRRNPWGLHDMHGNVWEWCWDWYASYDSSPKANFPGPTDGEDRVLRGGAFGVRSRLLRSAYRSRNAPTYRFRDRGFRCVRAPHLSLDR